MSNDVISSCEYNSIGNNTCNNNCNTTGSNTCNNNCSTSSNNRNNNCNSTSNNTCNNNCNSTGNNTCNNNSSNICEPKKEIKYASSKPYPPIRICERNPLYGRMMLDNVGGQNSEMSAVSIYLYNNLLIDEDPELSECFMKIGMVEMHHLKIFGDIARMQGENPRLWTHKGNQMSYWTPAYNNYPIEMKPLLTNLLNGEKGAVQKYEAQCEKIDDCHIKACLERIILDEKIHIQILERLYKKYCGS